MREVEVLGLVGAGYQGRDMVLEVILQNKNKLVVSCGMNEKQEVIDYINDGVIAFGIEDEKLDYESFGLSVKLVKEQPLSNWILVEVEAYDK